MRRTWVLIAVAVAALVAVVVAVSRPSEEDQIRAQLTRLAASLHVTAGSNPMFRLPRVRGEFDAVFDDPMHASVPELPVSLPTSRAALAEKAVLVTSYYQDLDVSLSDVDIKLDDAKRMAQVAATAKLSSSGETRGWDTRPVSFLLYKKEGVWRVTSVTVWEEKGH
jgi:hypothetical protein